MISTSNPEPALRTYNVVARYRSADAARNAVLALESLDADDGAVGVTVVELPTSPAVEERAANTERDPGPIEELTPRMLKGGAIGLVVGAVLIGGVTAVIDSSIWIGAAIGGAIFGLVVGAIWGAFMRMGGQRRLSPDVRRNVVTHPDDRVAALRRPRRGRRGPTPAGPRSGHTSARGRADRRHAVDHVPPADRPAPIPMRSGCKSGRMTNGTTMGRPTSARIEPVVEPDAELQEILAGTLTLDGTPLNIFGVLGRHPKLLKRFNLLGGFLLNKGLLPDANARSSSCASAGTPEHDTSSDSTP